MIRYRSRDAQRTSSQSNFDRPARSAATVVPVFSLLLLLVATQVTGTVDEVPSPTPVGYVGQVRSVGEDGKSFTLKAKKGPYTIRWNSKTVWTTHSVVSFSDLKEGTTLHVLGFPQEPQPASGGGTFPPQILKVQAIVAGKFTPPGVPPKLAKQKVRWLTGKFKKADRELRLDDAVIAGGSGRDVLQVKSIKGAIPKRGTQVFVGGYLDASDRKSKKIEAEEIITIDRKYKSYPVSFDLVNRKPKPKIDDGFGF